MKSHHNPNKLKPQPRHLFSCGFFRHCTQTIPSPTTPSSPHSQPLPLPPPPPTPPQPNQLQPPPTNPPQDSSSSTTTSSSSTSQSFTQWRFPTPISPQQQQQHPSTSTSASSTQQLQDLFHLSIQQLSSPSYSTSLTALHTLESSLVPNPVQPICPPPDLIRCIVKLLSHPPPAAKSATKILLALCLAEQNRRVAVQAGAINGVMEAVSEMERATAERALAALELMCTVAEGAEELRSHALAVPMMVEMMGRLEGFRGKEYAISVLAVIYSKSSEEAGDRVGVGMAAPEEVARAVALALQGECSARGRRKGALLLKILKGEDQRLDV